ncbi:lipase member H-like [Lucilia cuprina]|uniref:lipase member H-like n=1 Tax=Lucilia cuprina TaxID=7375 RepID=UPI001F0565E7|nr:lipase member H-like [Lucilia cuprina]
MISDASTCGFYTVLLAGSLINYSHYPKGTCQKCCLIDWEDDIKYLLYTRNQYTYDYLKVGDSRGLHRSDFNFKNPTVIYIHSNLEDATSKSDSAQAINKAFLKKGRYNIILVDWSRLSTAPWYDNSISNIKDVGEHVAKFIRFLLNQDYRLRKIHVIGFGMGAEVAGYIGQKLKRWDYLLTRVTGLDPPYFIFNPESSYRHLNYKVARFVDVIHTDGGSSGNSEAIGHADFYPNDGIALQPGCITRKVFDDRFLDSFFDCSHNRAWKYFAESVNSRYSFRSKICKPSKTFRYCKFGSNGKAYMGFYADEDLRGKFYLETNSYPPYGY